MITEIKFACVKCGQRMLVDSEAAGMNVECPSCSATLTIPKVGSLHDRDYAPTNRSRDGQRTGNTAPSGRAKADTSSESFADPELAALRQDLLDASVEQSRLADQLADAQADAAKVNANALHAQAELKSFQSERLALKGENSQLKQKLEATRAEAEETTQQLREREVELAGMRDLLAESQADRTAALRQAQSLDQQRAALDTELTAARARLATAAQTEAQLRDTAQALSAAEQKSQTLDQTVKELKKEAKKLRASLCENTTGKELLETTARLATVETERDRHAGEARQLRDDLRKQEKETRHLADQLKAIHPKLEEALRAAEAHSESRIGQDNEVLRGIVARQNTELEQKHHQIVRLKRARFGLRLIYVALAITLIALGVLAVKFIPALRF